MPAGTSMSIFSCVGVRPWPSHMSQGWSMTVPSPPHSGQGEVDWICPKMERCIVVMYPVPWQRGHCVSWAPSAQPVPWQSSQGARRS